MFTVSEKKIRALARGSRDKQTVKGGAGALGTFHPSAEQNTVSCNTLFTKSTVVACRISYLKCFEIFLISFKYLYY